MPIAMAIGAAMLPGTAAAQATTGNGGLELCPAGVGGLGSSWGPLSSAVGFMNCTAPTQSGSGMSFSLNNAAADNGSWGYASDAITARVTGYDSGLLELQGKGGISMLDAVNMNGNKISSLANGNVSSGSADAVNGNQLYQYTRYFNANSPSGDASTDAQARGASSVASGPSSKAIGANSSAYGANAVALVSNSVALGANSVASRNDSVSVGYLSSDGKSQYTRQITNLTAGAAGTDAVNLDQLNAAIASVSGGSGVVPANAVTYDNSTSAQITLKGTKGTLITNLKAGDASSSWSTDAVNGSQLYSTNQNVANVANSVTIVSNNLANVTNVVNNIVNNGIAGNPLVVTYDSSARDAVTLGGVNGSAAVKLTHVAAGDISSLASTDAVNGGQLYQTNQNLHDLADNVGQIGTEIYKRGVKYFHANSALADSSAVGEESVAIGGLAVAQAKNSVALGSNALADRANTVSVGSSGAERQITNVAVATGDTDAVNLGQMNAAISNASIGSGGSPDAVIYDTSVHDKLTLGGASASAPVALTNVAPGQIVSGSKDAVNGGQLYNAASGLASALGAGATVNADGTIVAPGYKISGTTYGNVGDALDALNSAAGDLVGAAKYVKVISAANAAMASGAESIAIGGAAMATGDRALAIGAGASAGFANAVAIGVNSVADSANTVSFGGRGTEKRITHIANGINDTDAATIAQLNALQSQLVQGTPQSGGVKSMLLGAVVPVTNYIAVSPNVVGGTSTSASSDMNAMAIGPAAAATATNALSVGAGSSAGGGYSTSVGSGAGSASLNSTAIGAGATVGAFSDNSVVIGYNSRASSSNALAMGGFASATGTGSVAIGYGAFINSTATNGMALGMNSSVSAVNGVAIGYNAVADRTNAVSVGSSSKQNQITYVAAGTSNTDAVNVKQLSGVISAIGGGAAISSNGTITAPTFTVGGEDYNDVGSAIAAATASGSANSVQYDNTSHSKVTLGGTGATAPVTLSNVANGVANNDAVNVAQLQAMGATIGTSGVVTNSFVAYDDSTRSLITLKGAAGTGTKITNLAAGTVSATSTDAINGSQLYSTNANVANLTGNVTNVTNTVNNIVVNGGGIKYFHANSTLADSSATGTNAVAIGGAASATAANSVALGSNSLANRANAVSIGATGSERQLINVANATNGTDAVNLSQLQAMGANVNSSGVVTNSFVAYDDTTKGKVTFGGVGATKAVTLSNVANGIANNDAVNVAQLQAMGATIGTSGTVTNSFVAYDDSARSLITLKGAAGTGTKITNLAAGTVSATSTDAINGSQLYSTNANVANLTGNVTNVTNTVNNIVVNGGGIKYFHANSTLADSSATGTNAVAIGGAASATAANSVALGSNSLANRANAVSIGATGSERQLINVANATNGTDAVNLSQLQAMGANVNSSGVVTNSFVAYDDTTKGKVTFGGVGATKAVTLSNVANGIANNDAVNVAQLQAMGATIGTSGTVTNSFVAYDDTTLDAITLKGSTGTKITNLTAGALSATSKDAVNGSQLYATNQNVTNLTNTVNNIANGNSMKYLAFGALSDESTADTSAAGLDSIALGAGANASQNDNVAVGVGSNATGMASTALGWQTTASGANAVAVGTQSVAAGKSSTALGSGASASATNSVALGANSTATRANAVSIGASGSERQLINVANATNGTDAVNLSQLQAMGANVNSSGVVTNSFVAYDDTTKGKVTFGGTGSTKTVTLTNVAAGVASSDAVNLGQLKQMGVNVDTSGNVTNSFVAYDDTTQDSITLKGANGTKLTKLAAATLSASSTDAVNGSQLYSTNANVANVAGNVVNLTNTVNNIVVNGGGIKYFHVNSTLTDSSATGTNAVAIGGAANASGTNSVALGSNSVANRSNAVSIGAAGSERQLINVANGTNANDAVNLAQLKAMGANIDSSGVVTNSFVSYDDSTRNKVTFGGTGSTAPVALTNVAAGKVASTSNDAVNGSQLYGTAASIAAAMGGGQTVQTNGTLSAPSFDIGGTTYHDVGSALDAVDGQLDQINVNYATNLKYVKVVSTAGAAQASGAEAIAIGGNAMATGDRALAIGAGSSARYENSTAIGVNATTDAPNTVSVGARGAEMRITHVANGLDANDAVTMAQLSDLQKQLVQNTSQVNGVKSMLLGAAAPVTDYIKVSSVVTGGGFTTASNDLNAMAIGPMASATGVGALTVGAGSIAGSAGSTTVGSYAGSGSINSTSIGANATVGMMSDNSVSIGYMARSTAMNALALGSNTNATAAGAIAMGYAAYVAPTATNGMSFGMNSSVSAANSVAIGYGAVADRANTVSVGNSKQASQITNVAAGTQNTDAVNLGQMSAAIANVAGGGAPNAVVYDTSAHTSITLGSADAPVRIANVADGVANNDAVNVEQLKAMGATIGTSGNVTNAFVAYDDTTKSKITLGGVGSTTPVALTNLAAGQITSSSKDAINGAQLYNTASSTAAALGGGSTVGSDGKVSKPSYTLNGTTYNDVGAALVAAASTGGSGGSPDAVKYDTSLHDKLTLGNTGTPVLLANVAPGQLTSNSRDAVNGAQLYNVASSAAAALGGGATVNTSGQISKPTYTLGGNTFNDVGSALAAVDAKATTGSVNGVVYDTSAHDMLTLGNAGTPVTIANVAAATSDDQAVNLKQLKEAGLKVDTAGNVINSFVSYDDSTRTTLTFNAGGAPTQLKNVAAGTDLTDAVNFGQMQSYVAQKGGGGTANGVAYDDSTRSRVTLGGVGSTTPVTLTNVAAGANATDAVNYSQFSSLQSQVNNLSGGGTGQTTYVNINASAGGTAAAASGTDAIAIGNGAAATGTASIAIGKKAVTAGDNSVAMGAGATAPNANAVALGANSTTDRDNSVSVGSAGSTRQITNVAAGTQATDAVNLGQLNNALGSVNTSINNVDRNAAKGIASASALNIVTPYLPGRTTINAGIANYRGFQAVGLGVSRWNEKGTINYNLGVSSSGGNSTIVRAGIGIVLGN
nr:Autotransporter adhesin UpaG [Paraburkholderia busanensis]